MAHNPNSKSIGSAFSAHLTAESLYTLQWATLSSKIAPSRGGYRPPSNSWFIGYIRAHSLNGITIDSDVFAHVTTECLYTLQWEPLSPKIAPSHGESGPRLTHESLVPSETTTQMASRSVQSFLHGWPQSVPILHSGTPLPPRNFPFPWGDPTGLRHWRLHVMR